MTLFIVAIVLKQWQNGPRLLRHEPVVSAYFSYSIQCIGNRADPTGWTVQKTAIRCLQCNIRKYILVRNWEWWRLYTKVLPLLDVHRAERELLDKNSELGSLTSKISDLEGQNKTKDDENARLKKKVQEISSQLSAFHSSVSGTGELLEQEASERFRLEEELEQSKMETERLSKQCHQLESELCEMKLSAISNGNYPTESDDEADDANVWRDKYKALSRELESTRRRMTDQAEEEIQDLMSQKRSIEKQLTEEREESDEVRRQLQNSKRKLNKMTGEMEDMRLLLESVQGRNSDLEKKQKRFDTDVTGLHDQMESDRTQLDTLQRERDRMASEKTQLNNTVTQQEDEINQLKRKCERLTNELDDYGTSGKDDAELATVRRMIRDLESKTQDQEEELDEQAGRIQQLEQAKLRLEMASQRDKQQFERDMEMKDEDIEKMKSDCQRKIRDYEDQIQDEIQRKEEANKMKRDLERRIFDLQTTVEEVDRGTERKLKKELRKYRTLYRDAKKAAESQSMKLNEQPEIKSLRNQLEDADFAKHMALKAKQQIENDMEELHNQIEAITRMKENAEERCLALSRENSDFQSRIEEAEDELDEVIRKNKQLIAQLSEAQTMNVDLKERVNTLEEDKILLNEKINALSQKLEVYQRDMVDKTEIERLEIKLQEAENKWEVEAQSRIKLEHQVNRLKGQIERIQDDKTELQNSVSRVQQNHSRVERQMKENKMELDSLKRQEAELKRRREEAETNTQNMEDELSRKKTELTLAEKRIRLLQESMENDGFNSSDDEELFDEDSDTESISSSTSSRRRTSFRHSKRLSKRGSSDMSFETFSTSASQRRRRIPSDDYIFPNGGLGTNGSLYGTESTTTPGRYQSRTASRSISKRVSRQNSFE
ncbi:unconventional myosin-XVIIIa-like [Clytia hemisphaerica]